MNLWDERIWTPMLLGETFEVFNDKDYLYEIKYDGIRAIIFASPKNVEIRSRYNKDITSKYPELENLKGLVKGNVIFDGEIVLMDNGKPSFSKLQERMHLKNKNTINYLSKTNPVIFVCFDILYENKNLTNLSLIKRKGILDKYIDNEYFFKSVVYDNGIKLFASIKKLDLEGIVAKERNSVYEISNRSNSWLKIKNFKTEEFVLGGYIINKSEYVISLLLGEYINNKLYFVGKVSLGKKKKLYKDVMETKKMKKTLFINFNEENVVYIEPIIKCRVSYIERTENNHLRQPFIP